MNSGSGLPGSGNRNSVGNSGVSRAVSLGTTLVVGMVVFVIIGYYIDAKRDTAPFWTICGMFAGLLYMGYEVWRESRLIMEESGKGDELKRNGDDATGSGS
jgi:F0F1-type ATP synthase assembly protein I